MQGSLVVKRVADRLNVGTIYTFIAAVVFATSVFAPAPLITHRWFEVVLLAVIILILEISVAEVSVVVISVTYAAILTSSTNFGLLSTELSLLLSLPFLLFYHRRRKLSVVFFNTGLYGISAFFALAVYKALGGEIGYYGNHLMGLIGYCITLAITNLIGTSTLLFFAYNKTISVREVFVNIGINFFGSISR